MTSEDVRALAKDALRHRLVLSYQALAEGSLPTRSSTRVLAAVPVPEVSLARPSGGVNVAPLLGASRRRSARARAAAAGGAARARRSTSAAACTACSPASTARRSYGDGAELAQVRPYVPGDDVRRIEWNVTARTGEPHVRVHLAERVLVTWLVLDTSPSMQFGTADRRKADVADGVALAIGHVATRRGNRLGVVTFGDAKPATLPPHQGRHGLLGLLDGAPARAGAGAGRRDLARRRAPRARRRVARQRGARRRSSPTSAARSTGASRCSS